MYRDRPYYVFLNIEFIFNRDRTVHPLFLYYWVNLLLHEWIIVSIILFLLTLTTFCSNFTSTIISICLSKIEFKVHSLYKPVTYRLPATYSIKNKVGYRGFVLFLFWSNITFLYKFYRTIIISYLSVVKSIRVGLYLDSKLTESI